MKKRRAPQGRQKKISDEAFRLWRLCRAIEDEGATERWEDDRRRPGRRREYLDAGKALATALGIRWFDHSPLRVTSETPPDYICRNPAQAPEWRRAWELRQALLAAEAAADREAEAE